jgi:hypothetical protein
MENHKTYNTEEFADKAWAEMHKLLDQELPLQNKDRKRPLFWWFVLAVALGLLVLGVWWHQNSKSGHVPTPSVQSAVAERGLPAHIQEAKTPEISNSASSLQPQSDPSVSSFAKQQKKHSDGGVASDASHKANEGSYLNEPARKIDSLTLQPGETSDVEEAKSGNGRIADLCYLPQLSLSDLYTVEIPNFSIPTENTKFRKLPGISLASSGFIGSRAGTSGLGIGLVFHIPGSGSRFSFEFGASYSYQRQPLSVLVPSKTATSGPVTSTSAGPAIVSFEKLDQEAQNLNRNYLLVNHDIGLQYFEFPAGVSMKLWPKLELTSGLNFGLLLLSVPEFTRGGLIASNTGKIGLDADPLEKQPSSASSFSVELNKMNLSVHAGLQYKFTPRIKIRIGYRYGLSDMIVSNREKDYSRLLQVSAIYRIK